MSQTLAQLIQGLSVSASAPAGSLVVTSGGLVGLGTSSPGANLDVRGTGSASVEILRVGNGTKYLGLGTEGTNYSWIQSFGSTPICLNPLGNNVGIGTTSPGATLHCVGTSLFIAQQSALFNSSTGTYTTWQNNGTSIGDIGTCNQVTSGGSAGDFGITSRAGSLVLGNNSTEKARIDTSGRLLVGTSSASGNALLQVAGDAQVQSLNGGALAGARNRIINGDMRIDQRNAGASGTASTYSVDRWAFDLSASSKLTWQQNAGSVTPPPGFTNYLGVTSSSAYSVAAGDYFLLRQSVEGFNISDFAFGTANAKAITLSFWVRSSLTGAFGGAVNNGGSYSYPFTYSISATNTWEYKTIAIPAAAAGAWAPTNALGMNVIFSLGTGSTYSGTAGSWASANYASATGSTSVVGTNGATFYITGVQLEPGTVATPFERRSYGQELALCQRYFNTSYELGVKPGTASSLTGSLAKSPDATLTYMTFGPYAYSCKMRTAPTVTLYNPNTGSSTPSSCIWNNNAGVSVAGYIPAGGSSGFSPSVDNTSVPQGNTCYVHYTSSAEL